ncbi:hypothetical protein RRG08_019172 [Elysia crispata]|uniref:Uncharacterized protein n=1 Tax=Elysia crispata TaxID=231223 RepID=A0AAE0YEC9_9GAST|nr:hypothetical protein RRG08_019172 [Elysia crispata]
MNRTCEIVSETPKFMSYYSQALSSNQLILSQTSVLELGERTNNMLRSKSSGLAIFFVLLITMANLRNGHSSSEHDHSHSHSHSVESSNSHSHSHDHKHSHEHHHYHKKSSSDHDNGLLMALLAMALAPPPPPPPPPPPG